MFRASTAILKHRSVTAFGFFCIAVAICGVIANSDSFEHIAEFGRAKHEWLRGFLELPQLLKIPAIEGRIVTIDAMGCRKDIAESIFDRHADCVLSLKGNQSSLHHDVKLFFENQKSMASKNRCLIIMENWKSLRTICMVDRERQFEDRTG